MAAKKRKPREKPELVLRSFKIDSGVQDILAGLGRDLTDMLGREVSQSAVLRGVIRWAGRQEYQWIAEHLALVVKEEEDAGVIWGQRVGWSSGKKEI